MQKLHECNGIVERTGDKSEFLSWNCGGTECETLRLLSLETTCVRSSPWAAPAWWENTAPIGPVHFSGSLSTGCQRADSAQTPGNTPFLADRQSPQEPRPAMRNPNRKVTGRQGAKCAPEPRSGDRSTPSTKKPRTWAHVSTQSGLWMLHWEFWQSLNFKKPEKQAAVLWQAPALGWHWTQMQLPL